MLSDAVILRCRSSPASLDESQPRSWADKMPGRKAERSRVVEREYLSLVCLFRKVFLCQMTLNHLLKF